MALSRLWGHQTSFNKKVKSPNFRGLRAGPLFGVAAFVEHLHRKGGLISLQHVFPFVTKFLELAQLSAESRT